MKKIISILFSISICLLLFSCETDSNNASTTKTPADETPDLTKPTVDARKAPAKTQQCIIPGTVLEDNSHWIESAKTLVGISADSMTNDIDFGESHRIFTAMNTEDCSVALKEILPVNRSPDFPWYLNTNTYESNNQVLCMQGVEFIFCYDVAAKKMLPRLQPKYDNRRDALDAQSGTPAGLSVWGNYLIAYSLDMGAAVFDLKNKTQPKVVLPSAEYYSENNESYHSLFLLTDKNGKTQAAIPTLNEDQDGMIPNLLFATARPLNTKINDNVKDNRFIVLNSKENKVAVDMEEVSLIDLPIEIERENTKAVLEWLKKR
ncbi:MAG: hypothetical protein AB8F74_10085 [Saprospiraceae bacterium]